MELVFLYLLLSEDFNSMYINHFSRISFEGALIVAHGLTILLLMLHRVPWKHWPSALVRTMAYEEVVKSETIPLQLW